MRYYLLWLSMVMISFPSGAQISDKYVSKEEKLFFLDNEGDLVVENTAPLYGGDQGEESLFEKIKKASNHPDYSQRIKKLTKIIEKYPKNIYARYRMGFEMFYHEDYGGASKVLDKVARQKDFFFLRNTLLMQGQALYLLGKHKECVDLLEEYIHRDSALRIIYGLSYLKIEKDDFASECLNNINTIKSKSDDFCENFRNEYFRSYTAFILSIYDETGKIRKLWEFDRLYWKQLYPNRRKIQRIVDDRPEVGDYEFLRDPSFYSIVWKNQLYYITFSRGVRGHLVYTDIYYLDEKKQKKDPFHYVTAYHLLNHPNTLGYVLHGSATLIDGVLVIKHDPDLITKADNGRLIRKGSYHDHFINIELEIKEDGLYLLEGNKAKSFDMSRDSPSCLFGDCDNGIGLKKFKDDLYYGEFEKSKMDGFGKYVMYQDGTHLGEFKDGKRHGKGIADVTNNFRKGRWENDVFVSQQNVDLIDMILNWVSENQ